MIVRLEGISNEVMEKERGGKEGERNKGREQTSDAAVGVGVPGIERAAAQALEVNNGEVWVVAFAWLIDGSDVHFETDQPESLARIDGLAFLAVGWPGTVEVEVVQVRVVEEADDAHPRAGHAVRVALLQVWVWWWAKGACEGL